MHFIIAYFVINSVLEKYFQPLLQIAVKRFYCANNDANFNGHSEKTVLSSMRVYSVCIFVTENKA